MGPGVSLEVNYVEVGEFRWELRFGLGSGNTCVWGWVNMMVDCSEKELSLHKIITFTWWCLP